MMRRFPILLALSFCVMGLSAQVHDFGVTPLGPRSLSVVSLQGQVLARGVDVSHSFMVELVGCQQSGPGLKSSLSTDGAFSFEGLEAGCHQLRVLTLPHREVVYREVLNIDRNSGEIVVNLRADTVERPVADFISLQQLLKPPPRKARHVYEQAVRSDSHGQTDAALRLYTRAIELFPDYASAHQGLALELEKLNRPAEAAAEWTVARRLGIESPELYTGLSLCLIELDRRAEAENAARQALAKDPSYAPAHYLLACSLVLQAKASAEALGHFARAAGRLPRAWLMSARLRASRGDLDGARREVGEFIKVCAAGERPAAERWLNELQTHSSSR